MEWIEAEPGSPELGPGEVHVWRFPLDGSRLGTAAASLTPEELARAEGMTSPQAARSFIASQSALREVLVAHTRTRPQAIEFSRGAHGKPMLAGPARTVEFNVSHSGDWGLLALALVAVGVDVEQIRPGRASARLAERFLTPAERELLRLRASSDGDAAFFVVWSRKEAYLKAAGFGLAAPFSSVDSAGDKLPDLDEHGNQLPAGTPWSITDFLVDDRHVGAVVARMPQISPTFLTLRRPGR